MKSTPHRTASWKYLFLLFLALVAPLAGAPSGSSILLAQNTPDGSSALPRRSDLTGFAGTSWKSTFTQVRSHLKNLATSTTSTERVEIINMERNRSILVKRNGILYLYNFYKTPLQVQRLVNHQVTEEEYDMQEALLFHVKVTPSFIESSLIKKKLEGIYGPATRSTVKEKEHRGAAIWEMTGGFIFQWYEPYHKTAYTRTIDYMSREMAEKIMKEYEDYFDSREKQLLKEIILE